MIPFASYWHSDFPHSSMIVRENKAMRRQVVLPGCTHCEITTAGPEQDRSHSPVFLSHRPIGCAEAAAQTPTPGNKVFRQALDGSKQSYNKFKPHPVCLVSLPVRCTRLPCRIDVERIQNQWIVDKHHKNRHIDLQYMLETSRCVVAVYRQHCKFSPLHKQSQQVCNTNQLAH